MSIQKHCVYYRDDENKIYYYDNSNHRKYVNGTFYDKVTEELYYFDENGERHVIDIDVDGYALSADVDTRLEDTSAWANDTFVTSADLEDDKQYAMTNSGWQKVEIPENTDSWKHQSEEHGCIPEENSIYIGSENISVLTAVGDEDPRGKFGNFINIGSANTAFAGGINIGDENIILSGDTTIANINIGKQNKSKFGILIGQRNESSGFNYLLGDDNKGYYNGSYVIGSYNNMKNEGSFVIGSSNRGSIKRTGDVVVGIRNRIVGSSPVNLFGNDNNGIMGGGSTVVGNGITADDIDSSLVLAQQQRITAKAGSIVIATPHPNWKNGSYTATITAESEGVILGGYADLNMYEGLPVSSYGLFTRYNGMIVGEGLYASAENNAMVVGNQSYAKNGAWVFGTNGYASDNSMVLNWETMRIPSTMSVRVYDKDNDRYITETVNPAEVINFSETTGGLFNTSAIDGSLSIGVNNSANCGSVIISTIPSDRSYIAISGIKENGVTKYFVNPAYGNSADGSSIILSTNAKGINYVKGRSIAVGLAGLSADTESIAIGIHNITADGSSIAIGNIVSARNEGYAIGKNQFAVGSSLAIGVNDYQGTNKASGHSIAIGTNNAVTSDSVSIGNSNTAYGKGFIFGYNNSAVSDSFVVGKRNNVRRYSLVYGMDNNATIQDTSIFGNGNSVRQSYYDTSRFDTSPNLTIVGETNTVYISNPVPSIGRSVDFNIFGDNNTIYSENTGSLSLYGIMLGDGNNITVTGEKIPGGFNIHLGARNRGFYESINIGSDNETYGHSVALGWNNKTNDSYGAHSVLLGDSNSSYSDIEYLVSARNGALVTANKTKLVKVEKNIISNEDIASIKNYANQIVNLIDNCSSLNNTQKTNLKKFYAWYSISYKADYLSTENNNILKTGWIWTDETYSAWYNRYYQAMYEYYYGTDKTTFINMIGDITTDVIQSLNNSTYEIWQNIDTIISKYETDGEIQFEVIPGYTTATDKVITNSFVAGTNNSANHYNSYVFGANNLTEFVNSANYQNDDGFVLAFGLGNFAARNYDMAIGYNAIASGGENIAIGTRSNSDYNPPRYTVAKGYKNIAYHSYIEGILNVGFASDVPLTFDKNNDSVYTNNIFNTVKNNVWNYSTLNFHDNRLDCVTGSTLGVQYNFNRNKLTYVSNSNIGVNGSYGHFAYNDLFMCDYDTTISAQYASKNTMRCLSGAKFYGTNIHDNIFYNLGGQTYISAFDINQNIIFDAGVNGGTSTTIQINLSATNFDKNYVFNSELVGSAMGAGFNHNLIMYSKITADNNALPNGVGYGYDTIGHSVLVGTNVNGQVTESFSFAASNTRSADAGAVTNAVLARVSKITNFGDNNIQNSYESQVFGEDNIVSSVGNSFIAGRKNLVQGPRNGYVVNDSYVTNNNVVFGDANAISNSDNAADDRLTNSIILGKANGIYKNCSDSKYYITDNTIIGSVNGLYKIPATAIDNVLTKGMYNWVDASAKFPYQNIIHKANESFITSGKYLVNLYGGNESYNNARNLIMGSHSVISNNINDSTLIGSFNAAYNSATDVWSNNYVIGSFNLAANGSNQIVLGNSNIASGHNAMPMGEGLIANTSQTVFGRYNEVLDGTNGLSADDIDSKSGALLIVGNGKHILDKSDTASIERSNAMIVSADGTVSATRFATIGIADLEAKILELENIISTLTSYSARWVLSNN